MEKKGKDYYYRWRVFVDESEPVLEQIQQVEYTLHPTFPQPHQVRTDRRDLFALETAGWGEFTMLIDVKYRDGRIEKVPYWLDLSKKWPGED
jgi:transcription initiation factor IIF auxiliary subunit